MDASGAELQKVKERKAVIDSHTSLLRTLQGRAQAHQQKLAKAKQKEDDFNAEERTHPNPNPNPDPDPN